MLEETIQNLEIMAAKLQQRLDLIENELRNESVDPETRISKSLNIIADI